MGWILADLGNLLESQGQLRAAVRLYEQSWTIMRRYHASAQEIEALIGLARLYRRQGLHVQGRYCWGRAYHRAQQLGHQRFLAELEMLAGDVHYSRGRRRKGLQLYRCALAHAQQYNTHWARQKAHELALKLGDDFRQVNSNGSSLDSVERTVRGIAR